MKEFKKDDFNFISLNIHDKLGEVLNKEFADLINTNVAKLIIDFCNEGQVRENWFFAIHRMIKKYKLKSSNIYFISCDSKLSENYDIWIEKFNIPKINIIGLNRYLEEAKLWIEDIDKFPIEDFKVNRIREKKFLCLNGAFRASRIKIVSELFRNGLDNDGYISLIGNYRADLPIKSDLQSELDNDTIKYFMDIIYPKIPIVVDLEKDIELIEPYIGNSYVHEMYINSYFNILTETSYNYENSIIGNNIFPTEKTYRAIFGLKFLKSMGFETFPEFFDESYDEIENPWERMYIIVKEIKKICSLSLEELHDRYYNIFDKLEHNRNRLIEIVDDREINYGNYLDVFE